MISVQQISRRLITRCLVGVFALSLIGQSIAQTEVSIPSIPAGPAGMPLPSSIPSSLPPGMSAGEAKALMQQYGVNPNAATAASAGRSGVNSAAASSGRNVTVNEQTAALAKSESSAPMGDALNPTDRPENNPSEYQRFVAATVGEFLVPYGSNLFGRGGRFNAVEAVPTSGTYVIGPGDEVSIKTWGSVDLNLKLVVNREGMINIPSVGPVRVAGLPFAALKQHLFEQLSSAYKGFELTVDVGGMKGVQVFVVGNARAPGSYTVNSAGTLMNALFASGGPSANGSMRKIQLKRGGSIVTEFDLYDFLVFGNISKDVRLAQGDIIYIPPIGAQVAVAGSVKNPAIYELRGNEAAISELIKYAGGVTATASGQNLTVERIDNRNTRQKIEIPLHSAGQHAKGNRYVAPASHGASTPIFDGSILVVGPLNRDLISIIGYVERPMRFGWRDGLRVKDLIPDRNYLTTPAFWKDRMQLNRESDLADVRQSNSVAWNYAVVERLEPDMTSNLIPFNLGKAIDGDPEQNVLLRPGDIIRIFSKADLRVPAGNERQFIRLEGEFAQPGVYAVQPGETLRQLIARTGGLSRNAYLYGSEFTRPSVQKLQQKQLEEYAKNFELEIHRTAGQLNQMVGVNAGNPARAQTDLAAAEAQIAAAASLLNKIKNAKALGRIVFEFDNANISVADLPDITLEDGDRFFIPRKPSTVGVYGAVFVPSNFFYKDSSTVGDYLKLAGGYTRSSDSSYVYVLHADGTIRSASQNWILGVKGEPTYAGDAIVVPDLIVSGPTFTRTLMDWAQIFYQFGLAAAGITVLKNM